MIIDIFAEEITLPYHGITSKKLKQYLKKIFKALQYKKVSISLIVTDNTYIHHLNKKHRHRDYTTDVISFAYRENPFPINTFKREHLGDIYISLEKAVEQSLSYGVSLEEEVKRLVVHGVLHLVGYDHEKSEEEKKRMEEKEQDILRII